MGSIKKAFDLTGKNALVTGGSRGLGLQIAEALGEQGARVVISSRKAPDLEKAQAHLAGLGIKAEWIAADNSKDEDVKRRADETIKKLGVRCEADAGRRRPATLGRRYDARIRVVSA